MEVPRVRPAVRRPSEGKEGSSELPVDLGHLRRYTLGDKALEDEVLRLFVSQLSETLASLRSAANQREWKTATHALKGSSRAVGAWRIAALAEEAEAIVYERATAARLDAIARLEAAANEASQFVMKEARRA